MTQRNLSVPMQTTQLRDIANALGVLGAGRGKPVVIQRDGIDHVISGCEVGARDLILRCAPAPQRIEANQTFTTQRIYEIAAAQNATGRIAVEFAGMEQRFYVTGVYVPASDPNDPFVGGVFRLTAAPETPASN
jgi:hypothetical protein